MCPSWRVFSCNRDMCGPSIDRLSVWKQVRIAEDFLLDWSFASNICRAVAKLIEVCFQTGFWSGQSLITVPTMPSAGDYGWTRKSEQDPWSSLWTTLLPAGKACIKCGQDKWCRGRCSCTKADIIVWVWWSVCKDWKCCVLAVLLSKWYNVQEVV